MQYRKIMSMLRSCLCYVHVHTNMAETCFGALIFHRIALKSFSVANRAILLFCMLATLIGSLISSDWQAFGHDPCHYRINNISNTSFNDMALTKSENYTALSHTTNATLGTLQSVKFDEHSFVPLSVNDSYLHADQCISLSTEDHACYWNPVSRVTSKLCSECHPTCRSQQKSINFVQFSIGFSVILFVSQLFLTSVYSVASDYTPKRSQVSHTDSCYAYIRDRFTS